MNPGQRIDRGVLLVKAALWLGLLLGAALGITLSTILTSRSPRERAL